MLISTTALGSRSTHTLAGHMHTDSVASIQLWSLHEQCHQLSVWGVVSLLYLLACALQYRYLNNMHTILYMHVHTAHPTLSFSMVCLPLLASSRRSMVEAPAAGVHTHLTCCNWTRAFLVLQM
jgi:hypothetical protein